MYFEASSTAGLLNRSAAALAAVEALLGQEGQGPVNLPAASALLVATRVDLAAALEEGKNSMPATREAVAKQAAERLVMLKDELAGKKIEPFFNELVEHGRVNYEEYVSKHPDDYSVRGLLTAIGQAVSKHREREPEGTSPFGTFVSGYARLGIFEEEKESMAVRADAFAYLEQV